MGKALIKSNVKRKIKIKEIEVEKTETNETEAR